jgi:phosphate transport system substrate-binding protein
MIASAAPIFRCILVALLAGSGLPASAEVLLLHGSANTTAPFVAAVPKLRELGIELKIDSRGNSSSAIAAVAEGQAQLGVTVRPVTAEERAAYPSLFLQGTPIAYQVLALVVPAEVWTSGVRALTREQMRGVYESEIGNWKQLGGEDRPIKFLNPEPGRGVWETFATWLYGDPRKAAPGDAFEQVATGLEARNVVQFNAGGISVLSPVYVDGKDVFALGIKTDHGEILQPTVAAARDLGYPLSRRLDLVSALRPSGSIRQVIDFMRSPAGRKILAQAEYLPAD